MQINTVGTLGEAGDRVIEADDIGIELACAGCEDFVQIGPVKLRVRRAVQLLLRQRKSLDHLAGIVQPEYVGVRLDADGQQTVFNAKMTHDVHGIGADLDARADFAKLWGLFINFNCMASLHQAGCSSQSPEARAGHQDPILFHAQVATPQMPTAAILLLQLRAG